MSRRVVLVTAAGKGGTVGFALARAFAAAGFDLVLTARNKGRLKEAALELEREFGIEALPVVLDVTAQGAEASVAQLVEQAEARFGRLDVLVNAMQAAKVGNSLQNTKMADLELALASGIKPAFLLMRACYPLLKASRGAVINLASAGAAAGLPGFSVLAASKEGLRGMSAVAANEWAEDGIAVMCLEPVVRTAAFCNWAQEYPQTAGSFEGPEAPEVFAQRCVAHVQGHFLQVV